MSLLAVYTTVADTASAQRLARLAVQRGLAACVQLENVHSTYLWQEQLHAEPELRLLFNTTSAAWPALRACLEAHHPYELPAIFAVPVPHASAAYAAWVHTQTAAASHPASDGAPTDVAPPSSDLG